MSDRNLSKFDPAAGQSVSRQVLSGSLDGRGRAADPEAIVAFLRGRHPLKTAEAVADEAGISAQTVRQWLRGSARPGFLHMLALIGAYGPEFLVAALPDPPRWLDEAHRAEQRRRIAEQIDALARRRAALGE